MNLNKQFSLTKPELIFTLLVFIIVTSAVFSSRQIRLTSGKAVEFTSATSIIIHENISLDSLIYKLEEQQIDVDEDEIKWASNLLGWRTFKRGRYELEGSYSYNSLLSKLSRGIQDPVSLVVLPGINPKLLSNYIAGRMHFSSDAFMSALNDSSLLSQRNWSKEMLFGRMLPETYLIYWTSSPKDVISRILKQFDREVVQPLEGRAEELGISIDEAVTMASIIEWEANSEDEKQKISGLYWNRLKEGMRLQADPTVNFVVGQRRRLLFDDYRIDHPYNTYVNDGLPPGPITNPSLSSIKAALYPEDHDYLFMVANAEGGHTFTRTFSEHREESEKWRQWLQQQYRIKAQREAEELQQESDSKR